ncbi:hypothetical protein SASPL_108835 [Salvia splendens]|uniref:AAA+ ATPase domain-containing protein n=1 Tax=Salvia splendens TaxID=180675 RepID=A0A8X8YHF4_SALSN|nr:hypothetical protein SASPL_108835 [Salvia splendens]
MAASAMVLDPKPAAISEPPPSHPAVKSDIPTVDEEDLYGRLKSLQRQIEFIDIQEEYVKDELKNLKRELLRAQEEVKRIQSVPLVIGQFMEMVDQNNGIVGSTTGSNYYVRILSTINRELLKPSASVALHRHSNALVDVLPPEADSSISLLSQSEKPDVTYTNCYSFEHFTIRAGKPFHNVGKRESFLPFKFIDVVAFATVDKWFLRLEKDQSQFPRSIYTALQISEYIPFGSGSIIQVLPKMRPGRAQGAGCHDRGRLRPNMGEPSEIRRDIGGCDIQKQEIREAVELPLTHHELYKQIGIDPPRGVLLYGPPGTGKTMLAKAVANHTTAAFIRVVGSEFVQKYLGEGPRMVRDVFRLAKENAPAIIFIDEVDAIATARFDAQTGADREVQRILMELLNQVSKFELVFFDESWWVKKL